jgi:hypothetical protein
MLIGVYASMWRSPSCGMERAIVPRKTPIAVAKKR